MKNKKILIDILMILLFIFGIGAIAYPFVSDSFNDYLDQQIINYYQNKASKENFKEMNRIQAEMEAKNKELAEQGNTEIGADPFGEDEDNLPPERPPKSFYEENTIGVITIPNINVRLPIFNQTNPIFLEKGASLLEGTSYPTGGDSTHSVITSHAGLMNAKLFTDLEKMEIGDVFYIETNNRTLAYEVDQIKVVLPTELEDVQIVDGEDYVTLLTCTPYMINTHRLLIRGKRIPYVPETTDDLNQVVQSQRNQIIMMSIGVVIFTLIILWTIYRLIYNHLISNRTYILEGEAFNQDHQPLQNVEFSLLNHKKKPLMDEKGETLVLKTNEKGYFKSDDLTGGKYLMRNETLNINYSIYIKRVKDSYFSFKNKNKSAFHIEMLKEKS